MPRSASFLVRPLDWVFSAGSHVAVMRALRDSKEGMSGRAVAREAGINHQACAQALKRLEGLGIVRRQGSGRTQLLRLNFRHFMVKEALLPLLRKERELGNRFRSEIRLKFQGRVQAAAIFGSAARGESEPGSDIDLLLVTPAGAKAKAAREADDFSARFVDRYGVRLSAMVMTPREVRTRFRRGDPLLKNILLDGIDLLDARLKDLLS